MIRRRQPGTGRAAAPQTLLAMLKLARPNLPLANHNAKIVQFFSSLLGHALPQRGRPAPAAASQHAPAASGPLYNRNIAIVLVTARGMTRLTTGS
jgi:hypothetical protein